MQQFLFAKPMLRKQNLFSGTQLFDQAMLRSLSTTENITRQSWIANNASACKMLRSLSIQQNIAEH